MSEPAPSDTSLMLRYQRGDRAAFGLLLGKYSPQLFNFLLHQLGDAQLAEELSRKVFLTLAERAPAFKHETHFATWFYAIARDAAAVAAGHEPARAQPGGGGQVLQAPPLERSLAGEVSPEPRSSRRKAPTSASVSRSVFGALAALPREQREVYLLREIAELGFKDIAFVVRSDEDTVRERLRHALASLQSSLSKLDEYAQALR